MSLENKHIDYARNQAIGGYFELELSLTSHWSNGML